MTDLTREQIAEYAVRLHPDFDGRGQLIKTLARQLLATLDALAEAQAAQAGVVSSAFEAGAKAVHDEWVRAHQAGETPPRGEPDFSEAASDYASVADPTGVKLLAELRAERDNATRGRNEWRDDYKALAKAIVGETGLSAMTVAAQARLYRPRAEAAEAQLAEVQKREAGLRDAIALALRKMQPIQNLTAYNVLMTAISAAPTGEESNG